MILSDSCSLFYNNLRMIQNFLGQSLYSVGQPRPFYFQVQVVARRSSLQYSLPNIQRVIKSSSGSRRYITLYLTYRESSSHRQEVVVAVLSTSHTESHQDVVKKLSQVVYEEVILKKMSLRSRQEAALGITSIVQVLMLKFVLTCLLVRKV